MASAAGDSKRKRSKVEDDPDFSAASEDEMDSEEIPDEEVVVRKKPMGSGITRSRQELESEIVELKAENKRLKATIYNLSMGKGAAATPAPAKPAMTPQQAAATAEKTKKNILKLIEAIMVYRKGQKHGKSRINLTIPSMPPEHLQLLLGQELFAKISKSKTGNLKVEGDALEDVLGGFPSKPLRYGSSLSLYQSTLGFKYSKEDHSLCITGYYCFGC